MRRRKTIKNNKSPIHRSATKVVPFQRDAAFFSKKAKQSWEKSKLDKALRYFKFAIEFDNSNSKNYCSLASLLTEMGHYEESNHLLWHVVDNMDSSLTECFFFIANNYAHLQKYEQSRNAIMHYIENDRKGYFIEESAELISFLQVKTNPYPYLEKAKNLAQIKKHTQVTKLFEEGKFQDALKLLESMINQNQDDLTAYNLLAITKYQLGNCEQALYTINQALQRDPAHLHALCNQAIFMYQLEIEDSYVSLVEKLRKIYPISLEHIYKLATTMGLLQQHDRAFLLFRQFIQISGKEVDSSVYHYAAVAACHLGYLHIARGYWKFIQSRDKENKMVAFYLDAIDNKNHVLQLSSMHYFYQYPHEQFLHTNNRLHISKANRFWQDAWIRTSLVWVLNHEVTSKKLHALQILFQIADIEAQTILQEYIASSHKQEYPQKLASFILKIISSHPQSGTGLKMQADFAESLDIFEQPTKRFSHVEQVVEYALQNMHVRYHIIELFDAEILWKEFLNRMYPHSPACVKIEGWAASLEYLIAKMYSKPISFREVAVRYRVSVSTIQRHVRHINRICRLKENMQVVVPFLENKNK